MWRSGPPHENRPANPQKERMLCGMAVQTMGFIGGTLLPRGFGQTRRRRKTTAVVRPKAARIQAAGSGTAEPVMAML